MMWNKLNDAKSVVLLHEDMHLHRDICDAHQLRVIDDAQLMTVNVIHDALLQAVLHNINIQAYADLVLWRYELLYIFSVSCL